MSVALIVAALLLLAVGAAHSYLGERYVMSRLFRRGNLPTLFGAEIWTKRILRFAWHLTTVAWVGFAAVLLAISAEGSVERSDVALVVVVTFVASAAVAGFGSRGRHPAWLAFLVIAALAVTAV
jgi:hypothetical protein